MSKPFFILVFILSFIFSNELSISVIDKSDLSPLQDANIIIKNDDGPIIGGITNRNGNYKIENLDVGFYKVEIRFIGYKKFIEEVEIISDFRKYIECFLEVESILIPELEIISSLNAPYEKLPGSAYVVNTQSIRQVSPLGTQEILERVPGITAFSDDGIGNSRISIGIRGLNPRRSSRVLILEDGIPIQPALYVYPNMYYNPPVERIDGVQVIKGSGTVKYGPQTMGGVINYYTSRPQDDLSKDINLVMGENGYKSLFTDINGFGTKKIKNSLQLLFKQGDGFRQNNSFNQINGTFKTNYNISENKNLYLKLGSNYENSNATYTGLTEWSFEDDPKFNPKDNDNFEIFRSSLDIIHTEKINNNIIKTDKLFSSYFDRRWWRENDIFILKNDFESGEENSSFQSPDSPFDLVRTGNGSDNFGILRTFYVLGFERQYALKSTFLNAPSKYEYSGRVYWERFIDDKKIGNSPDARDGIYYYEAEVCNDEILTSDGSCVDFEDLNDNNTYDDSETVVGQSHNYETMALSGYISNTTDFNFLTLSLGARFELFEQERIDRLDGSTYLDQTTFEVLPSISFIKSFSTFSIFGGVHRGFTAPSSGALKVTNFVLDAGLDLKAEKSWNKELGIRSQSSSFIDYEISFFHVDIEDMVAAGRGTAFTNLGKISTSGTELNSVFNLSNSSKIHITHTYLKTTIDEGRLKPYNFMSSAADISIKNNELPYSPEHILIIGLEQNLFKNIILRFDYKYVSEVYTDFHNIDDQFIIENGLTNNLGIMGTVPSYNTMNFSLNYDATEKISINIIGKNIMDEIYIGSRLHSNPGQKQANISSGIIPGNRRQINFGINYKF